MVDFNKLRRTSALEAEVETLRKMDISDDLVRAARDGEVARIEQELERRKRVAAFVVPSTPIAMRSTESLQLEIEHLINKKVDMNDQAQREYISTRTEELGKEVARRKRLEASLLKFKPRDARGKLPGKYDEED